MGVTHLVSLFLNLLRSNTISTKSTTPHNNHTNGDCSSTEGKLNGIGGRKRKRALILTRSKSNVTPSKSHRFDVCRPKLKKTAAAGSPWMNGGGDGRSTQGTTAAVNGHAKSRLNGLTSSCSRARSSNNKKKESGSSTLAPAKLLCPCPASSAYAKHYKSYRRNSGTLRRSLLRGGKSSRSPSKRSQNVGGCDVGGRRGKGGNKRGSSSPSSSSSSTTSTPLHSPREVSGCSKGTRRSALWVLNCEAEEFLFGETAAEKHELELPPSGGGSGSSSSSGSSANSSSSHGHRSPPPKKRRGWRETELRHLLETSPFLESKLRSASSSSSSSSATTSEETAGVGAASPPSRQNGNGASAPSSHFRRKIKTKLFQSPRKSRKYVKKKGAGRRVEEDHPKTPSTSSSSCPYNLNMDLRSPLSNVDRAALLQETLEAVKWHYSFEVPPTQDSWYSTFSRRCDVSILSYKSFLPGPPTGSPPLRLPYEMDKPPHRRSQLKLIKNSRKSPRCHASTLAILSSTEDAPAPLSPPTTNHQPTRPRSSRNRNSSSNNIPTPGSSKSSQTNLVISTSPSHSPTAPAPLLSPFTKFVAENSYSGQSASTTRRGGCSSYSTTTTSSDRGDPYQVYRKGLLKVPAEDLSAQQYLWDSIQFLSDPYVVAVLAGEEHPPTTPPAPRQLHHTQQHPRGRNRQTSNKMVQSSTQSQPQSLVESSSRKASLRSCDGAMSSGNNVPLPKASPAKSTNGSHGGSSRLNGITTCKAPRRSPTTRSSLKSSSTTTTSASIPLPRSSPPVVFTKSPLIIVSDVMRKSSGGGGLLSSKRKGEVGGVDLNPFGEDLLFAGERFPALSWPV